MIQCFVCEYVWDNVLCDMWVFELFVSMGVVCV